MLALILFGLLSSLLWYYFTSRLPSSFPPGPRWRFPVLGSSLSLKGNILKGFDTFREEYGDIFGLYMGPIKTVVLCNVELIQEAFSQDIFSDRPSPPGAFFTRPGRSIHGSIPGVLFSSGQTWQELRRFSLSKLRDLGYGKSPIEELIADETQDLLDHLESLDASPINCTYTFNVTALNSLWHVITGEKLSREDPRVKELVQLINQFLKYLANPLNNLVGEYYWMSYLRDKSGMAKMVKSMPKIKEFSAPSIKYHQDTFQPDNVRNLIDAFLLEQTKASPFKSAFSKPYGDNNLRILLVDLFFAGSETTASALNWAMLFMVNNPEIQKKVQDELESAVGRGVMPTMLDRVKTPFTEAVLCEVQRRGSIIALAVTHRTRREVKLGGYTIPVNTNVFSNLRGVMHDPANFPDPYKFDPSRHLTKDGTVYKPHPMVIPFGIGKRRCLGENLAKMSFYRLFTGIMQRFVVTSPQGSSLNENPVLGLTLVPKPYQVAFNVRN